MRNAVTIGSAADCDIRVDDGYVSAWHCWITGERDGRYWVTDLASTNGTQVRRAGGEFVWLRTAQRCPLNEGDVIVVGKTRLPPFTPPQETLR